MAHAAQQARRRGGRLHLKLAQIDADGNGEISDEEVKKYPEDGQDAINRMLELCLNSGIVSALILSFVTPALLTTVEQSDEPVRRLFALRDADRRPLFAKPLQRLQPGVPRDDAADVLRLLGRNVLLVPHL